MVAASSLKGMPRKYAATAWPASSYAVAGVGGLALGRRGATFCIAVIPEAARALAVSLPCRRYGTVDASRYYRMPAI